MKEYTLDFVDFIHHDNGILEAITHEDVEINGVMASEFLNFIENIQPKVSKVLVNRINKYSYTFKANLIFAKTKLSIDVAVVKYGRAPWPFKGVFFPKFYHLAFFDNLDEAMNWLSIK